MSDLSGKTEFNADIEFVQFLLIVGITELVMGILKFQLGMGSGIEDKLFLGEKRIQNCRIWSSPNSQTKLKQENIKL